MAAGSGVGTRGGGAHGTRRKKFIRVPHTHYVSAGLICCVVVHFALFILLWVLYCVG